MNKLFLLRKIAYSIAESYKAFRLTPSPYIVMTILVRNEEDVLEQNLLFHKAMGVDAFIITDNNSTDGTLEIIRKFQRKGWVKEVILEKGTNHDQKVWVDRMVWKAKTVYKADWVINADADELWYAPTGNLKNELSSTHANVINCEVRNIYPEEGKPLNQWDKVVKAVDDLEKYDLSCYSLFEHLYKKVLHRTTCYIQISNGNHKVVMLPKYSKNIGIIVYHYPNRGKIHFMRKMINGGKSMEQNPSKHAARHWRYFYQLYKEGKLEAEYDRVIGAHRFDELCKDGYIQTDTTLVEFFKKNQIINH